MRLSRDLILPTFPTYGRPSEFSSAPEALIVCPSHPRPEWGRRNTEMSEGRLLQGGHTLAGDQPRRGWHKQKCLSSRAAGELTGGHPCQVLPCVTCILAVPPAAQTGIQARRQRPEHGRWQVPEDPASNPVPATPYGSDLGRFPQLL